MARSIFLLKYKSVKSNTSNNLVLFLRVYSGFVRVLLHIRAFCATKPEETTNKNNTIVAYCTALQNRTPFA